MLKHRISQLIVAGAGFATALAPVAVPAGDGVIELNQACATQTGCVSGDTAGFPITLTARGSYRLTSNLQLPNQNTDGIEISSNDVTLDFNGFTLFGPNTVSIPQLVCSLPGTGEGISATGAADGFVAMNGRVRGMGAGGIALASAQTVRIERMSIEQNCGNGVSLGTAAIVSQVQARGNAGLYAIRLSFGGIVRDSVVEWNNSYGIFAVANSVIANNVAASNGASGIRLASESGGGLVIGNSLQGNGWAPSPWAAIDIGAGVSAVLNSVYGNEAGIVATTSSGVGLNTISGNSLGQIQGGVTIGCNSTDTTKICP